MAGERRGAHFLSRGPAARLVAEAHVGPGELVFDLGAGHGVLTAALAETGARVVAVERDERCLRRLQRRFAGDPRVRVQPGDIRTIPLPRRPFRVVANLPFAVTSETLDRLLATPMSTADLVVADGVTRLLTADRPGREYVLRWALSHRLERGRPLPPGCFHPPPSVHAATLRVRRRASPLLEPAAGAQLDRLLAVGYRRPGQPWTAAAADRLTARQLHRLGADRQLAGAAVRDLSLADWLALVRLVVSAPAGGRAARSQ